jgi:hypothetical protein
MLRRVVVVIEAEEHRSRLAGGHGGTAALLSGVSVVFGHG